ncbi:membrane steroid-binding protein 2 [Cajanus cajan]|uniref:Membrane steroid-binding protein 2 n=1 Tax=Cajanus cajan TaxID=3821 RepID=A0A151R152_CAJCA|nr:membrane steroid-binding protein 2 [Cajanus cajan]KYP36297.1 Membrane steroid-binding protein 2 [Cajanus cajan]
MGLYTSFMEEISLYTGLSPTAFFTILAMMVVVYRTVSAMFVSPQDYNKPPVVSARAHPRFDQPQPPREPVHLGEVTDRELRSYDGSDPNKPLLMAIKGQIYDVSTGRNFYGPGGPYAMFAGKECSRALALLSFKPEDINGNLEGLEESELTILEDWEFKFIEKYPKVGQLVSEQRTQQNEVKEHIQDNLDPNECKEETK